MPFIRRAAVFRLLAAALGGWGAYWVSAQSDTGTLRVEIVDERGAKTAAMVCITSEEDQRWRTPPDGRFVPPYAFTRDFQDPPVWTRDRPGPVFLTNGDYQNNQIRSIVYGEKSSLPFWQEPAAYLIAEPFSIDLPPGEWRLAVMRGLETLPHFERFSIAAGESLSRTVQLTRWENMAAKGWFSGDDHVHHPRMEKWHDEFLMAWSEAEDVHVSSILRMGNPEEIFYEQHAYGPKGRFQRGERALVPGQEDPRNGINEQGHVMALNISAPSRDTSRYHLYDVMFDEARAGGGLAGYAHKAWAWQRHRAEDSSLYPTWDSTLNVVRGKVDFFEILQFRHLGVEDYYDFLNLGFRLTASAGSDWPVASNIGEVRVYVNTGGPFSVDRWFEEFAAGRTFVSNGPMISLEVDGAGPGEEVEAGAGGGVRIAARAWSPQEMGSPRLLEVISHGKVIARAESKEPGREELRVEISRPVEKGQWIAARTVTHNEGYAHTSPVYVFGDGREFFDREDLPELVRKRSRILDFIEGRLEQARPAAWGAGETEALRERVEIARRAYAEILERGTNGGQEQ